MIFNNQTLNEHITGSSQTEKSSFSLPESVLPEISFSSPDESFRTLLSYYADPMPDFKQLLAKELDCIADHLECPEEDITK